jgi:hypothetical protein
MNTRSTTSTQPPKYEYFGVNLSISQAKKVANAMKKQVGVTIRLTKNKLHGDHKLPLTKTQINRINKSKNGLNLNLSAAQLKHCIKSGGILPLLALLPLIFGGIGAAGTAAGGAAAIATAVKNSRAAAATQNELERNNKAAQNELERHNKAVEAELKGGSGIISNIAEKYLFLVQL